MADEPELIEVYSARCERCGAPADAAQLSGGALDRWPVVLERGASQSAVHERCGGRIVSNDVRPFGHMCAEGCECLSGGLPERVS